MLKNKYSDDLCFISKKIREVYKALVAESEIKIFDKAEYDEVTSLDLEIEKALIKCIKEYDSKAIILSEEYNFDVKNDGRVWIVDPIDGTCNLSHSIQNFGVQCALVDEGEIQLSVIYLPFSEEMFTALRGYGAWLNGKKIEKSTREAQRALVSFGDFSHTNAYLFELEHEIMKKVSSKVERIRMYGAASIDFAYCACGRLDANFTFVSNLWDIAPGLLLCEEAGMIIVDAFGEKYHEDSKTVAVFSSEELKNICCKD